MGNIDKLCNYKRDERKGLGLGDACNINGGHRLYHGGSLWAKSEFRELQIISSG